VAAANGRLCTAAWAATTRSAARAPAGSTNEQLAERGLDGPHIIVVNGMRKPNAQLFTDAEYRKHVRALGEAYLADVPRSIAR
jgi:hypothetical protein